MIVHSDSVGIMWRPYVPAASFWPATETSEEKEIVVFSLAPARQTSL